MTPIRWSLILSPYQRNVVIELCIERKASFPNQPYRSQNAVIFLAEVSYEESLILTFHQNRLSTKIVADWSISLSHDDEYGRHFWGTFSKHVSVRAHKGDYLYFLRWILSING